MSPRKPDGLSFKYSCLTDLFQWRQFPDTTHKRCLAQNEHVMWKIFEKYSAKDKVCSIMHKKNLSLQMYLTVLFNERSIQIFLK